MSAMTSQITGVSIVCSNVCSGADERTHQSFGSYAFASGIHPWPVDSPHKGPVTQKMFTFDGVTLKQQIYSVSTCTLHFGKYVRLTVCMYIFCLCTDRISSIIHDRQISQMHLGLVQNPVQDQYLDHQSKSTSNFEMVVTSLIFKLDRQPTAQNTRNSRSCLDNIHNFRWHFHEEVHEDIKMSSAFKI